jgi:hypothetical protein
MGIIKDFRDDRTRRKPFGSRGQVNDESLPKTTPKILDLSKLCSLVDDVLDHAKTKDAGIERNRKWDYCYEAPVGRLLGYVDKPTWVFMLESAIEFAIESRSAVQPNGRWELLDWEHSVEDRGIQQRRTVGQSRDGTPEMLEQIIVEKYIIVGMRFVDVVDGEELQYEMGRPTTNKGLTADGLKKLIANGGTGGLSNEEREAFGRQEQEIKRQEMEIELLKEQLSKSNALMAGILEEMQKEKAPTKKKAKK